MGEVSEAAIVRACQLLNEACGSPDYLLTRNANDAEVNAFARYIQRVSDVACPARTFIQNTCDIGYGRHADALAPFILPEPVDPLVDALEATGDDEASDRAWRLRAQLAQRGLCIAEAPTPSPISTIDSNSNQGPSGSNVARSD